ncbi:basic amino-acid permease [Monosporozyma unispora]|nr:arginine transporter Can1 [Kazachstania unispora]
MDIPTSNNRKQEILNKNKNHSNEILTEPEHLEQLTHFSFSEEIQSTQEPKEQYESETHGVKRQLKQRHIAMIALGGTIGTGLFIGIAQPLMNAGPVGSLIAYLFMGTVIFSVTQSLGEMVTLIPVTSSFTVFSTRFLSPALGAANGYMYWFSWAVTFAVELSVVGQIIFFWTEQVPLAAWISIFWIILITVNMFPVRYYGEIEFWVAFTKVISIMGFILFCICIVCGAGPVGAFGFRYWKSPGPWGPGIISSNKYEARFLGWVSSLINAAFTYQGTELVGVTAGEAANPRKSVPKAIKKVVARILIFYILSLFLIGLLVPYNDPKLVSTETYVSKSPFIIAIQNAGVSVLPSIFNGVILLTIISAGNSNVYVGSRILYGLAKDGSAPKLFKKTTKSGVPYVSVLMTSLFGSLAYLELSVGGGKAFEWLLNVVSIAGFFAWLLISLAHIRFMKALRYRGISRDDLPYKAICMPWLAYYAVFFMIIIIITQGFTSFTPTFNKVEFVASYISLFLFIVIWLVFQIWRKCRIIWKIEDIDIDTDRKEIDDITWEEDKPQNFVQKFWMVVS